MLYPKNESFNDLRVLVVEDNDQVRRLVQMVLRELGINQIYTAKDGVEAMQFVDDAADLIDFIISDWNMPRMTGLELLAQVHTTHAAMPFLMLTARHTIDDVKAARDKGVTAYLAKPLVHEQLEEKIRLVVNLLNRNKAESTKPLERFGVPKF